MNLIPKNLHMLLTRQVRLKLLNIVSGLITRREHGKRDLDAFGLGRVNHSRVAFSASFERSIGFGGGDRYDFAAPTELFVSVESSGRGREESLPQQHPKS
jgi:hypothetical protein